MKGSLVDNARFSGKKSSIRQSGLLDVVSKRELFCLCCEKN
uniref:ABC transporter ATP-binding protein n=1 Tax=Heterorhabditis bacteriophora TaxID=37862 RepID=A0A1I7X141_HETBA